MVRQRLASCRAILFATFVAFGSGPVDRAGGHRIRSVILITIGFRVPGLDPTWSSWAMIGIAAVLAGYGVLRDALRPPWGLPLQSAAIAAFAVAAITAINLDVDWAGLLVGAGLLAHTPRGTSTTTG